MGNSARNSVSSPKRRLGRDETFIGGKRRNVARGYIDNKVMVLSAIERGGSIRLKVEKRRGRKTLHAFVDEHAPDTEKVYTDDRHAYDGIGDETTEHHRVTHSEQEYVRGDVHTNGIEGAFSLLKRSIVGSYHQISAKHLPVYLDGSSSVSTTATIRTSSAIRC